MSKQFLLIALCSISSLVANNKILIITHVHSRPDFIELHDKTFKAFLQDDYEYVVFNDAPTDAMRIQMEETCARLGIRCIRIPQELHIGRHSPTKRHIDGIQYSLKTLGFDHDGIVLMIDSDMFLIKPLSITNYVENFNFIGCYQERASGTYKVVYSAPCLVFMDMRTLPNKRTINFEDGIIQNLSCDNGGHLFYYFMNNPTLNLKLYLSRSTDQLPKSAEQLKELGHDEGSINFILTIPTRFGVEFHGDNHFIHYYAGGSNWPGYTAEFLAQKTVIINKFIDQQIEMYSAGK